MSLGFYIGKGRDGHGSLKQGVFLSSPRQHGHLYFRAACVLVLTRFDDTAAALRLEEKHALTSLAKLQASGSGRWPDCTLGSGWRPVRSMRATPFAKRTSAPKARVSKAESLSDETQDGRSFDVGVAHRITLYNDNGDTCRPCRE